MHDGDVGAAQQQPAGGLEPGSPPPSTTARQPGPAAWAMRAQSSTVRKATTSESSADIPSMRGTNGTLPVANTSSS